ncbi:RDD family protein [Polystyrenella longa]|uniref:RDD family protein n=1 Tax=Polystyrenella longa TaxID=2528007 RepID=A0A518CUD2_9PLAN|nr:RDD family protein [Polystyrenella longa]QDU82794.1 RDD family protein [Polystyrenella longa]
MRQRSSLISRRLGSAVADNVLLIVAVFGPAIYLFSNDDHVAYFNFSLILGWWIYFAFLERSPLQGTLFKRLNNFQVTDLHGNRVGIIRATVRHIARILTFFTFMLGYLTITYTRRNQALHDWISGTVVVDIHPEVEDELDFDSEKPVTPTVHY